MLSSIPEGPHALWTSPDGLEGSSAFGAVGIGTGAVLSRIPEGTCTCGAEGPMASIGPVGPRCQGLCRKVASLRSGGHRLAVRIAMENHIGAMPRTPFPASRDFPSRGNERYEEKNGGVICFMYYSSIPPFGGWRHHLSRGEVRRSPDRGVASAASQSPACVSCHMT